MMRVSLFIINQVDRTNVTDIKRNTNIRADFVRTLDCASYLRFISPTKLFGLFSAESIPHPQGAVHYVATYGGVVCTEAESTMSNEVYRVAGVKLPIVKSRKTQPRYAVGVSLLVVIL